jgi:hypothetical protein
MSRTGLGAGSLISHAYATGQICGIVIDPNNTEADEDRGVLVSKDHGWVIRYFAPNRCWIAD